MLNELYHFATPWAKATKRQINVNRMLGVAANALYPIYCAWSPLPKQRTTQGERMVVSLTTFPLRIGKVHLTIQSILRQSRPADRILLWLSKEEFPEEAQLPANLLRLKEKGLDIRFCDNIRSFKKVFYTAQEFENDVIVTADDDALYPENWLEGLWDTHEKYPGCVCCYRAHEITFEGGRVAPYQEWYGLSPDKKRTFGSTFSGGRWRGVVSCRLFQRHRVRQREDYEAVPDGGRYVAQDRGSAEKDPGSEGEHQLEGVVHHPEQPAPVPDVGQHRRKDAER